MKITHINILRSMVIAVVFCLQPTASSLAASFDDSKVSHIAYPGWFNESPFHDLTEDLQKAKAADKIGLMVLFTTEGCSYCEVFIRKSLGDPKLAKLVQKHFSSVGLEIFDDSEMTDPRGGLIRIKHFAKNEGAHFSPTLLFYGHQGKLIHRSVGYESPERFRKTLSYLIGNYYQSESFRDYLKRTTSVEPSLGSNQKLRPDSLFIHPPYALARNRFPASQPLIVLFEKKNCRECAVFHDEVLVHSDIRRTLKKFEIVRLDANDGVSMLIAPDGTTTSAKDWYDKENLTSAPAILFFNENGKEVLKIDALALRQRMMNSLNYVLERAYKKGWTYQRFARSKGIARNKKKQKRGR